MTKRGSSYLAASFLTSRANAGVATTYAAWIDTKEDATAAEDALLAAARSSKSPTRVLLQAQVHYDSFNGAIPIITSLTPATGAAAGGTVVVIAGENFTGVTGVTFGGVAGTALTVTSDTSITVTTGAHAAGAVDAVVTNPSGADTATAGYTYT